MAHLTLKPWIGGLKRATTMNAVWCCHTTFSNYEIGSHVVCRCRYAIYLSCLVWSVISWQITLQNFWSNFLDPLTCCLNLYIQAAVIKK